MRKSNITIYDLQMRKIAMLENAVTIGYETPMNALWTATFELPLDDPKNEYCQPFYYVELYDLADRMDLYRILPNTAQRNEQARKISYSCEHVLATLIDDILFQYHTVGNLGVYTSDSIQYILDHQSTKHWKLGTVDFNRQFEYNWENTNLFSALFSVPRPFSESYMWTWDTASYPWTLNLIRPSDEIQAVIRYGHNMNGITRHINPTNLVNRIYALGYGEGVNQLNFADINGGIPYIEDVESIAKYGVKQTVWVDRRFTSAETLLGRAEAILEESKNPRTSYTVDASELYALTKDPIDKFKTGAVVRVQDPDLGDHEIRVVNVKKGDVWGERGKVQLEIANRTQNIATALGDLETRLRIEEVYAQGATNVNVYNLAENCDPMHPAILRVWIPEEAVRINKVLLTYQNEAFRANSKAIEGGGAVTTSTAAGGAVVSTTAAGGFSASTTSTAPMEIQSSGGGVWFSSPGYTSGFDVTSNPGTHDHGIPQGTQLLVAGGGSVAWTPSGAHVHLQTTADHRHTVTIPAHAHNFQVPDHVHGINLPNHTHGINLPNHTHGIEFGIYEGPKSNSVVLEVDEVVVTGASVSETNIDLTEYFAVDDEGKILRGQFHEIRISPDTLSRVVASVVIQFFVQSRGGGNY